MDEIVDFVRRQTKPVVHYLLVREAAKLVPSHAVMKVLEILSLSGRLGKVGTDERTGQGLYIANEEGGS
jgi:hypothetical protein